MSNDANDMLHILNDIRTYIRISAATASKAAALNVINLQEKAQVYQKLSENKSQVRIEQETGVPIATVNRWIGEFVEAGLVTEPNEYSTEYKALFSLRELGVNVTELGRRKARQQSTKPKEATVSETAGGNA
ncbi:MAG: hypothetical protein ACFCUE_10970 [Candidatus Bathyarchaeia archaeon]|jgi:DNA-binding MarR family transcriptional regulator